MFIVVDLLGCVSEYVLIEIGYGYLDVCGEFVEYGVCDDICFGGCFEYVGGV